MERKVRTCRSRPPPTIAITATAATPQHKRRRTEERSEQLPSMPVLIDPESFQPEPSSPTHRHRPKKKKAKKRSRRDKSGTHRRHSRHNKPEEEEEQEERHDGEEERKDMLQTKELVGNVSILEQLLTDKPRQHRRHRREKKTQPKQYHRHRRQDAPSSTSTVSTSTAPSRSTTPTSTVRPRHWFGQKKRILEQWRREHCQQHTRGDSDS